MNIAIIDLDLAKNIFQVCALSVDGTIAWNRKASRPKLSGVLEELPKSALIAMEACSSSNFWDRYLLERCFRVAVIPAQHVKHFAKHQKNDANDALAICEAAMRRVFTGLRLRLWISKTSKPFERFAGDSFSKEPPRVIRSVRSRASMA